MKLRMASKDDMNEVYRLICELEDCNLDKQQFEYVYVENLEDNDVDYVIAMEENSEKIIGFISVHTQKLLHHAGKIAEIQEGVQGFRKERCPLPL